MERDAIRLYRSIKMSALSDSWTTLPDCQKQRFRDLAADAFPIHEQVAGECVCGEPYCVVALEYEAVRNLRGRRDRE